MQHLKIRCHQRCVPHMFRRSCLSVWADAGSGDSFYRSPCRMADTMQCSAPPSTAVTCVCVSKSKSQVWKTLEAEFLEVPETPVRDCSPGRPVSSSKAVGADGPSVPAGRRCSRLWVHQLFLCALSPRSACLTWR